MAKKKKIAFLILGVGENFGGAERFFANVFDIYSAELNNKFKLYFITDQQSVKHFERNIFLKTTKNIIILNTWNNRFKKYLEFIHFFFTLLTFRINAIHVPVYGIQHFYHLKYLSYFNLFISVKIIINIEDCRIAYAYSNFGSAYDFKNELKKKYDPLFDNVNIDGIYCWYEFFKRHFTNNPVIRSLPMIESANYCFADLKRFNPSGVKKNYLVYAARLEPQKQPIMFLEAIRMLNSSYAHKLNDWRIIFVGYGSMENQVEEYIAINNLSSIISFKQTLDMSSIYSESKCFISTQDFENFTSLSMLEAMAAGNAIIARNVGQTNYFVKDGVNGILAKEDSVEGIAQAILYYVDHPELHESMAKESVYIATQVHTAENFIKDLEDFWTIVLEK